MGKRDIFDLVLVLIVNLAVALCLRGASNRGRARAPMRSSTTAASSLSPRVVASTYLGGPGTEITWACATDAAGNVYIAGDANEAAFPVTPNALQTIYGDGGQDGFVAKFDKNGN